MDHKKLDLEGEVVARNVSQKELTKKDGGTYYLHSFVIKCENGSDYPDNFAFKTNSSVINEIRTGYKISVTFSMEGRAWKEKDTGEIKLKVSDYDGSELHQCFVNMYAFGVEVLDGTNNTEEVLEANKGFEQSAGIETDNDPLPF